jgi:hypothetical protein
VQSGWEGWLKGARLAKLRFDAEDMVRVGVLRAEQNGFLVLVEEGDFPRTGPWHRDGWVVIFSRYYYFGRMVYMDPFDERFFDSSGFLVLIQFLRVVLPLMIRRADIAVGWMLAIGGFSVGRSCYLRFPSIRVCRVSWGG